MQLFFVLLSLPLSFSSDAFLFKYLDCSWFLFFRRLEELQLFLDIELYVFEQLESRKMFLIGRNKLNLFGQSDNLALQLVVVD